MDIDSLFQKHLQGYL